MISKELLDLLVCPASRTPLALADASLLARLNEAITARRLRNKAGQTLEKPLDGALVREDMALAYPILDGIPILLVDEALPLDQIAASEAKGAEA